MESLREKYGDQQTFTPFFILIWLTVFLRIALGNTLLNRFMSYTLPGGMLFEKIHPAIYLLTIVIILLLFYGKITDLVRLCWQDVNPLLQFFLISFIVTIISVALKGTSGMGYLVNTHISAAALGIVTYGCSLKQKKIIKSTILIFIFINSLLAIGEFLFQQYLIGYAEQETMFTFRSAAFFGHPLNNSLITGSALFFLFTTQWSTRTKFLISSCYAVSLLCYGGRMASIICVISMIIFVLVRFFRDFREKPQFLEISIFIFGVPLLVLIGIVLVHDFGIGARIFERELLDQSGMARIKLFSIFSYIPIGTLFTGMPMADIEWLSLSVLNLPIIENFWVLFILMLGLPAALLLGGFLIRMLWQLCIHQQTASKVGALAFLLIASSNNSLATKSVSLTIIILLLVTTFTPIGQDAKSLILSTD